MTKSKYLKPIKTDAEFVQAKRRLVELARRPEEGIEQLVLQLLVETYDSRPRKVDPIAVIRDRMKELSLTDADMVSIFGSTRVMDEVFAKRRVLSASMILGLNEELGIPLEVFGALTPKKGVTKPAPELEAEAL